MANPTSILSESRVQSTIRHAYPDPASRLIASVSVLAWSGEDVSGWWVTGASVSLVPGGEPVKHWMVGSYRGELGA